MYGAIAAAAVSAYGAYKQGQDQQSSLDYKAQVEAQNARATMISAKLNADKQMMQFQKLQGSDVANYGASGVESDSGSVLSILASNAAAAELDRQNILYGGHIRSINYQNQSSMDTIAGNRAAQAGTIGAIGSAYSSGAKMYGQYSEGADGAGN